MSEIGLVNQCVHNQGAERRHIEIIGKDVESNERSPIPASGRVAIGCFLASGIANVRIGPLGSVFTIM